MPGLTADQKKSLDELIVTYGTSLNRSDDEAELRKSVEEKAERLGIKKGNFRALAKAVWKGTREIAMADLSDQIDLFDLYGDLEGEQATKSAAWRKKNGVDQITLAGTGALQ